ncbi:MAG: DUF362 domain-containing protein [Candidatus Sericytochromatia bacterium]|nr:DUF362 domain-containing protein [Candidatus Sericytochromatia bacterium]
MASDVIFAHRRATNGGGLLEKLDALYDAAALSSLVYPGALTAVLLHFGEIGNLTHVRPPLVRRLVTRLRQDGATPFLTGTLPAPPSPRRHAVDLLNGAQRHGFEGFGGIPLVAADGLTGGDQVPCAVPRQAIGREVPVAGAIAHADSLVSIAHVTAHPWAGFAGALLQLGFEGLARVGKATILGTLDGADSGAAIAEALRARQQACVEAAAAIFAQKEGRCGFVNVLLEITPDPDGHPLSDTPIVADIGLLGSRDPVALDQATADLVLQAAGLPDTRLSSSGVADKWRDLHPSVDWEFPLQHAQNLGLGSREYELMIV